jgi:hypothetical protein
MANIIKTTSVGREYAYNQSYQKSQSEILSNPNQYGLYTADQYQAKVNEYNRGVTDGRNYVIDHSSSYDLFTESQVKNHDYARYVSFKWLKEPTTYYGSDIPSGSGIYREDNGDENWYLQFFFKNPKVSNAYYLLETSNDHILRVFWETNGGSRFGKWYNNIIDMTLSV